MEFILAVLLVYGLTNIVVRGSIFDGIKDKLEDKMISSNNKVVKWGLQKFLTLTSCPMCTGFWIGAGVGYLYGPFEEWNVIFNGAIYSGICWLFHCFTQALGQGDPVENTINIYNVVEDEEEEDDKKEVLYG